MPPLPFKTLPSCTKLTEPVVLEPALIAPRMNTLPQPVESTSNVPVRTAERSFTGHPHSCEKGITFGRIGCQSPIPRASAEVIFSLTPQKYRFLRSIRSNFPTHH